MLRLGVRSPSAPLTQLTRPKAVTLTCPRWAARSRTLICAESSAEGSGRMSVVPAYRKHKQSGQGIVTLRDALGGRRDVLLGAFGTTASKKEYARIITEWEARGR